MTASAGRSAVLGIGSLVRHDGGLFAVVEMTGRRLLLRRHGTNELRQVDVGWLLSHPTTSLAGSDIPAEPAASITLATLGRDQDSELSDLARHIQEVLTGYRNGSAELALPGEPRAAYIPELPRMARYAAKASELGVGVSTLRRWVARFTEEGPAGLLPPDTGRGDGPFGRVDPRWVDMARTVLAGHVNASRPTRAIVLAEIEQRLIEQHGSDVVVLPARSTAYGLLRELGRGTNAFTGSAKGKRSIASRPQGVYGRLRASRPGEYVLLDTNRLDVYAMEPVTCRWVQVELTAAMDLYSRCISGLRLTPVSTKAADVAGCLYDTVRPQPQPDAAGGQLPYHGIPATVVVDARKLIDSAGAALLPSVAAETVVYDRGQIYLSNHVRSVCARLGISMQPARPRTPTDKSPLERWFRTLGEGLLVALPGYKGADVHSRGLDVEDKAFFFLDELEAVIREWIDLCYHRRPHRGLTVPQVPGLAMSPLEMFEHGVQRAGYLTIPDRPELAYDFLQPKWTTIQHYGVDIGTLRYDGPVLVKYRNTISPFTGVHAGRWPFAVDPADVTRIYFQDPADNTWHTLRWEHAAEVGRPLSAEALSYARSLAANAHRFPDTKRAVIELLDRWGAGLTAAAAERRMALRLSQQQQPLASDDPPASGTVVALPNLDRITAIESGAVPIDEADDQPAPTSPVSGDLAADDDDDECDAAMPGTTEPPDEVSDEEFYADAMDSA